MTETKEISKSVGGSLQKARETAGLTRTQVAESLRLRVSVIEAIETGNLEVGVPTTFVRGYIKNYARLLNIPSESILPLLETLQNDGYEDETALVVDRSLSGDRFDWRWWLAFTAFVTGGLFLFVYLR